MYFKLKMMHILFYRKISEIFKVFCFNPRYFFFSQFDRKIIWNTNCFAAKMILYIISRFIKNYVNTWKVQNISNWWFVNDLFRLNNVYGSTLTTEKDSFGYRTSCLIVLLFTYPTQHTCHLMENVCLYDYD